MSNNTDRKFPKLRSDWSTQRFFPTAWTSLKAIQKYERFANEKNGTSLDGHTKIETIEKTSLGVEGWALSEFGNSEKDQVESFIKLPSAPRRAR